MLHLVNKSLSWMSFREGGREGTILFTWLLWTHAFHLMSVYFASSCIMPDNVFAKLRGYSKLDLRSHAAIHLRFRQKCRTKHFLYLAAAIIISIIKHLNAKVSHRAISFNGLFVWFFVHMRFRQLWRDLTRCHFSFAYVMYAHMRVCVLPCVRVFFLLRTHPRIE